jgi:hypothetical protein
MTRHPIVPGVWADADGNLHFSVPELLAIFGWPDDDDHRALLEQTIREVVAKQFPGVPIVEDDEES